MMTGMGGPSPDQTFYVSAKRENNLNTYQPYTYKDITFVRSGCAHVWFKAVDTGSNGEGFALEVYTNPTEEDFALLKNNSNEEYVD